MSEWTDERIELLKSLWLEGATSTVIAQRLQISRSAALGKIRRLGMQRNAMTAQDGIETVEALEKTENQPKKIKLKPSSKQAKSSDKTGTKSAADKQTSIKQASLNESSALRGQRAADSEQKPKPVISEKTLENLTSAFLNKKAQNDQEKKQVQERRQKLDSLSFPISPTINLPFPVSPSVSDKSGKKGPGISIWELKDNLCKWPMGGLLDPPELFCGAATTPGCPWCEEHRAIAFTREPIKVTNKSAANANRLQQKR